MSDVLELQQPGANAGPRECGFALPLGITRGLDNAVYHAERSAVSSSQLKRMLISPAHYKCMIDGEAEEQSEALLFGTVVHGRLLEPESFAERFYPMPKVDKRNAEGKALAARLANEARGKTVFPEDWLPAIDAMVRSAHAHPKVAAILSQGEAEAAFAWIDPETGIKCKCKPDWWRGSLIADVKSAIDASMDGFSRACARYAYHLSAAMYLEGVERATGLRPEWCFVALEKGPPFCAAAYKASPAFLARGRADFRKALRLLAECRSSGCYPGYQPDGTWELIDLPRWA